MVLPRNINKSRCGLILQIINPHPWAIHDPSKGGLKKTNAQNKAGNAAKVNPIP
jgi:hypothetical protein